MLSIKRPSLRPKRTAPAPKTKKTRLKTCLQQGSLFALVAVMAFTVTNPAYMLELYNAVNPAATKRQNVAALDSPLSSPFAIPLASSAGAFPLETQELNTSRPTTERTAVKELTSERTAYTKTFLNSDGTRTMEYTTEQQHYQKDKDSPWEEIDNTLEEKKTKDDIRYFEGDAGAMSSTMKRLSDGLSIDAADKQIAIKPVGAANVQPERKDDRTIVYRDAWPGVDLEYELRGESVKEVIIVKSSLAPTTFNFNVSGGKVVAHPTEKGALTIDGLPKEYRFTPLSLDVNGRGVISEQRVTQAATKSGIAISFDKKWFASQPASAFPMRIDPSITKEASSYKMFKSDGYSCTGAICYISMGSVNDGGWKHWRSYFTFPYSQLNNKTVLAANLQGTFQNNAGGDTTTRSITMGYASCTNKFNCLGSSVGSTTASKNFTINFTSKLKALVDAKSWNAWWSLKGVEGSQHSFKPYNMLKAVVTYDTPTPMAQAASPAHGATVVTTQPTVQVNAVTDADGDAVQYYHRISTNPDAETGAVINSGWTSSRQWTVPEHILQDGRTYYWHTYTRGNVNVPITNPTWVRSFKVDLRTGKDSTQAYEEIGPIAVDLATGNATTSTGSHSISALGGDIGIALSYNTPALVQSGAAQQTSAQYGLTGYYYNDPGATRVLPSNPTDPSRLLMVRNDHTLRFDWGTSPPGPGMPADNFLVRWKGYITVPTATSYTLGVSADDGVRIKLGTGLFGADETVFDGWNYVAGNRWGIAKNLPAGTPIPITIEYYEAGGPGSLGLLIKGTGLPEQLMPVTWLAPNANILPDGWELATGAGSANFERLQASSSAAVLSDSTGQKHEFIWNASSQTYTPPKNQDAKLSRNSDYTYTLVDADGQTYIFDAEGKLTSLTAPADDRQPAALKYEYAGNPSRLVKISDGVNTARSGTLHYAGDSECQVMNTFDAAPAGHLCVFKTTDGKKTTFQYKAGHLARVAQPGDDYEDYQYDGFGRIMTFRDSLANDAIAYSVRSDDASTRTEIGYNPSGKVTSVKAPAPTAGADRQEVTVEYLSGATALHVTGASEPHGFSRKIAYDSLYRTISDTDVANLAATTQWHADKDLVLSSTGPTGLKSTTIYDDNDRPIDSYGPAPASWFDSNNKPLPAHMSDVPRTQTGYDEGIKGLGVAVYGNTGLVGAPKLHATGMTQTTEPYYAIDLSNSDVTPTDGLSIRATGKIKLDQAGTYDFRLFHGGGARLYIDNRLIVNNWTAGNERFSSGGAYVNSTAGKYVDVVIEANKLGATGSGINSRVVAVLHQKAPGQSGYSGTNLTQQLTPAYNLTTSTTSYDAQLGNTESQTIYSKPEYGLVDKAILDPAGLNYENKAEYEAPGTGFLRQTSKTLPGGAKTTYEYYSASDTRDNPCTTEIETALQAGKIKSKVEPDPDDTGPQQGRKTETIYDDAGRVVASRYNTDPWTCVTYDERGRATQTIIPAYAGNPMRTITNDYLVDDNPLITSISDSEGTITTEVDLLGQVVRYVDATGSTTTNTYDAFGKLTSRTSIVGTETFTYDNYDRPTTYKLDGATFASISYDSYGRVQSIQYPAGLSLEPAVRDQLDRVSKVTYRAGTQYITDEITRSVSGIVLSGIENGVSKSYSYDKVGRLTQATIGSDEFAYEFGSQDASCTGAVNPSAARNSNRTKLTINGQVTTYCYDYADRLTDSSDVRFGTPTYDSHGNTLSLGTGSSQTQLEYDSSDRNTAVAEGTRRVEYIRDATDRIIRRTSTDGSTTVSDEKHVYSGSSSSPAAILDASDTVVAKYITLPGGVNVKIKPQSTSAGAVTYSLTNIHGDTMATVDADGAVTGTYITGPFGEKLQQTIPPNATTDTAYGYVGYHQKITESELSASLMQMGARVYIPELGRFLQVDPVEGGTLNSYVYAMDPVNQWDLSGEFAIVLAIPALPSILIGTPAMLGVGIGMLNAAIAGSIATRVINDTKANTRTKTKPLKNNKYRPVNVLGIRAVQPVAPLAKNSDAKKIAMVAVQGALHSGWNPGELITTTDKIKDGRLRGHGWEKYKVVGDGFEIHYMVNVTNPNDKRYTDLKAKDNQPKKR